ncbi:MAG: S41 family peptidase [Candidatus Marinimicrobia bacterium]|nr:S41 family peptidase [Candidatus Neomarinimicrobiota bacterium]
MKFYKKWQFRLALATILSFTLVLALSNRDIYKEISKSVRLYNEVYKQIYTNYVDPIKVEEFTEISIKNMVKELDPYTVFLTAEEREPLDMLTKGEYGGIGLRISTRRDTLTVISPMEGSPAKRAGIFPGDQILKVDSISTIGLSLNKTAKMIRGKVGTKVKLTIRRPGIPGECVYALTREKIKVVDVTYSGLLQDDVGYIRLSGFSKGASDEVRQAITKLSKDGSNLKALILDMRGNPGGLLTEALKVSEIFTQIGDTLLFTRGRTPASNKVFIANQKPFLNPNVKVAVLIDRGSASASEIVSGIIQDLDRGIVLGRPSFGKGLVQTVFRLDKIHSIKITTAKYYIPSGRLIQKPDYLKEPDLVESNIPEDSIFYSHNGRKLKGGGGINPDIEVSQNEMPTLIRELWRQNMFYTFAIKYKSDHPGISENIEIDDEIVDKFRKYLIDTDFHYNMENEKELRNLEEKLMSDDRFMNLKGVFSQYYSIFDSTKANEFNKSTSFIKQGLTNEFATLIGGLSGRVKASLDDDLFVNKTLDVLLDNVIYETALGFSSK